jgi:hypothetical protein
MPAKGTSMETGHKDTVAEVTEAVSARFFAPWEALKN